MKKITLMNILARILSVLFHPLLILTYMLLILMLLNPYVFGINSLQELSGRVLILRVFISTFFIPAVAVATLVFIGLVDDFELSDRHDRIGPYIITAVFYLWMFRNFLENPQIPDLFTTCMLGATIGLFLSFFINIFSKISAHAVGMGGLIGMLIITMVRSQHDIILFKLGPLGNYQMNLLALLLLVIILAGLVGTSRLQLKAHEPKDLYGGYVVGLFSQFVAMRIMDFL